MQISFCTLFSRINISGIYIGHFLSFATFIQSNLTYFRYMYLGSRHGVTYLAQGHLQIDCEHKGLNLTVYGLNPVYFQLGVNHPNRQNYPVQKMV